MMTGFSLLSMASQKHPTKIHRWQSRTWLLSPALHCFPQTRSNQNITYIFWHLMAMNLPMPFQTTAWSTLSHIGHLWLTWNSSLMVNSAERDLSRYVQGLVQEYPPSRLESLQSVPVILLSLTIIVMPFKATASPTHYLLRSLQNIMECLCMKYGSVTLSDQCKLWCE